MDADRTPTRNFTWQDVPSLLNQNRMRTAHHSCSDPLSHKIDVESNRVTSTILYKINDLPHKIQLKKFNSIRKHSGLDRAGETLSIDSVN